MKSLIFGYGVTGKSVEKYLKSNSQDYFIYDDDNDKLKNVHQSKIFEDSYKNQIDNIVVSPGVNPNHSLFKIFDAKISLYTDIDLFSKNFKGLIIGVTGTNGKTTLVNLLSEFLKERGINASSCGNIGISPLEIDFKKTDTVIIELSSFQLYYSRKINLDYGIFINFHPDHLDWHKDLDDYRNSKLKLLNFLKSKENLIIGTNTNSSTSLESILNVNSENQVNDYLINKFNLQSLSYPIDICLTFLKTIKKLEINLDLAFEFLKIENSSEHRFEIVDTIEGTIFINDSKSTNFHSLSTASTKVNNGLLIMHGMTKNIPNNEINISKGISKVIIPKNMQVNRNELNCEVIEIESIFNLEDYLINHYTDFDAILFSCGGSSFVDFKNYKERGEFFKKIVKNIKKDKY